MKINQRLPQGVKLADHASQSPPSGPYAAAANAVLSTSDATDALNEIRSWDQYDPTPLISLTKLATALDCGTIAYKDESKRFGLGSFCLLYTSPSPRDGLLSRMPSSA